jgi:hypothetical protein
VLLAVQHLSGLLLVLEPDRDGDGLGVAAGVLQGFAVGGNVFPQSRLSLRYETASVRAWAGGYKRWADLAAAGSMPKARAPTQFLPRSQTMDAVGVKPVKWRQF